MSSSRSELNTIDFSSLRLIGREEESERLEEAYEGIIEPNANESDYEESSSSSSSGKSKDCLLVAGRLGCGKTKLVDSFRATVIYSGGTFASGKFDQLSAIRPYSALVNAIGNLCQTLAQVSKEVKADIARHLESELGLLYRLVPSARIALQNDDVDDNEEEDQLQPEDQSPSQIAFIRVKLMVRKLFQAVTMLGPFVLFLDDMQYCDASSIELINYVLEDEELHHFLFIGAYRDDEITQEHDLGKLGRFQEDSCTMHIRDLSEQSVNRLVADALRLDISATLPLSREIHRKTAGNCFFVMQFLKFLEFKEILKFCLCTYQWTWDMERITTETYSTDNVVDVVVNKLQKLPRQSQTVLAVAACCGNKFVGEILDLVFKSLCSDNANHCLASREFKALLSLDDLTSDVDAVLIAAVEGGFVDKLQNVNDSGMAVYKFAHEKVQATAYNLVASDDKFQLHALLGKILWQVLPDATSDQRETLLVKIVEQLHRAGSRFFEEDEAYRVEVVRLNLEAARNVQKNAAFLTAAEYLRSSATLLGEQRWAKHYHLTLETLNLKAEVELCCRRYVNCKRTVLEILSNATCIEDKMQAYVVWTDCLGSEKKTDEILKTVYGVVSQLGFRTPKQKAGFHHMARQIMKTKRAVKHFNDEELLTYRVCDDRAIEGCLKLLSRTGAIAWVSDSFNDVVFICMLMCYISLTKGFTKYSANSFGAFSLVITKMGDIKAGRRFGRLSLEISDRFQAKECDGNTVFLYYAFIHHMSKPMQELLDPLIEASQLSKAGGDIESSHHACVVYTFTYILCGLPLSAIEQDAKMFINEIKQYKHSTALANLRLFRQMTLNLISRSDDPFRMEGEEIPHLKTLFVNSNEIDNNRTRKGIAHCQLLLACYLGRGKEGKQIVARHAKLKDHEYPVCFSIFFPYLRGMVLLRLAREGCRGCRRQAAREIRRIRSFVRKGFVNCTHLLHILEAGMLSIGEQPEAVARKAFDKAIAGASRSGFPNDAGLASEQAAIYFKHRDRSRYEMYLDRAEDFYRQWGAGAKIDFLLETRGGASQSGDGVATVTSAIRGKSRRDSFTLNRDHETTDWFNNITASKIRTRRNLSISGRKGPLQELLL